jgi:hypothetical protein
MKTGADRAESSGEGEAMHGEVAHECLNALEEFIADSQRRRKAKPTVAS